MSVKDNKLRYKFHVIETVRPGKVRYTQSLVPTGLGYVMFTKTIN